MPKISFSPKEAVAEAANNILKIYLIANGSDEQTASMFGAGLSGAIKGVNIERRKFVRSSLDDAIKSAWVEILSREEFESLNEDCKTELRNDVLSARTAIEDLSAESPVIVLRERIKPILRRYTNESESFIHINAGNMSQQLLLAVNDEIEHDGILTLLEGIEQLKKGMAASTDKLENIDAELSKFYQELIEKLEKIESDIASARPKDDLYKQLKDLFDYERENHASIRMMNPDPLLFPKGLPEILSDGRYAVEDKGSPRVIRDMILDSWRREDRRHILLVGEGGIGKTVVMLTLPEEDWFKTFEIPAIYVPLQRLDKYEGDLNRYLEAKFGAINYNRIIELANCTFVERPRLLLLLDGFNEIPDVYKKNAGKYIREWMERPGIQIITTSRLGFSLENHCAMYRLQPLPYDTVRSFLLSAGIKEESLPEESDRISKVINIPLMLTIYTQIEKVKEEADCSSAALILDWKEPDNAAHIIWDYLQMELYRSIERDDTAHSIMQYTIAIFAVAPYICCQMSHQTKFYIKQGEFIKLIRKALTFFACHENLLGKQLLNVRRTYDRYEEENLFQTSKAAEYARILIDNIALFQEQETRKIGRENEYIIDYSCSLMHQNFRDALAAFFICSCLPKMFGSKEKKKLLDYSDYYVKNYMAEHLSNQELISIWNQHREKEEKELYDGQITFILLDLIGRQRDYDYRELDFSGIDLTKTNLHRLLSRRMDICPLSQDKENFKLTKVSINCLSPDGHTGSVNSVAYSPDGRHIAICTNEGVAWIWDLESGGTLPLQGYGGLVRSVAYSPDGRFLANGTGDSEVQIWDLENRENRILPSYGGLVRSVAYSPDGRHLASGEEDGTVHIWDLESGESRVLQGHENEITSVAYSPDGRYLASGAEDGTARIWDLESGESRVLQGQAGGVTIVAYSPYGRHLASVEKDGTVRIWDLESGESRVLQGHEAWVTSVAYSPDGRYLASGKDDGTVHIWDLESGESRVLQGQAGMVTSVAYSPDGRSLVSGAVDSTVRIWDLESGESRVLVGREDGITSVVYSPDGMSLASGANDSTVRIWNLESGESRVLQGQAGGVTSVAYSPDGKYLSSGAGDSTLRIWDLKRGKGRLLQGHEDMVSSVAYSPDGRSLASGADDSTVRIWDVKSGESRVLQTQANTLSNVAYSPDGRFLVTGASYGVPMRIWDLESGESRVLQSINNIVTCVSYSPDGRHLANGEDDGTVRIWDLESGESRAMQGHEAWVTSVLYSPDGRYLSSGAVDSTVRIWDLESGESHVLREGYGGQINSIAYSPDGKRLACGTEKNTVQIWDIKEYQEVEKFVIIPHMNLCGANFELALIDDKDKELLKAAGVRV